MPEVAEKGYILINIVVIVSFLQTQLFLVVEVLI